MAVVCVCVLGGGGGEGAVMWACKCEKKIDVRVYLTSCLFNLCLN